MIKNRYIYLCGLDFIRYKGFWFDWIKINYFKKYKFLFVYIIRIDFFIKIKIFKVNIINFFMGI